MLERSNSGSDLLPWRGRAAPRFLKADSKAHAVLLLRRFRDLLLWRNGLLRADLRRVGGLLGNVVPESRGQFLAVIGEDLHIVCSARDRDVSHPAVEQILGEQFRVNVNQDTTRGLSLAGMAGHCV